MQNKLPRKKTQENYAKKTNKKQIRASWNDYATCNGNDIQ